MKIRFPKHGFMYEDVSYKILGPLVGPGSGGKR